MMGSLHLIDTITVVFANYESTGAVSASTCSRQVSLSANIKDKDELITGMKAIIDDTMSLTMP